MNSKIVWRKSSYSSVQNACVELAIGADETRVRDSKLGDASPVLVFAPNAFAAFVGTIKAGHLAG